MHMRSRTITIAVSCIVVIALSVFAWTTVHALWYAPDGVPVPAADLNTTGVGIATSSLPSRLIIPALDINANVQYVGVNAVGDMRAPDNFTDVSWYRYGTVPGYLGSAVIAGHVDNGLGLDGVFKHLDTLKVGDDVYIQRNDGTKLLFVVSDIELYPYQDVPTELLFAAADTARLNLITCDGTWVPGGDTYDHRLVIYTTLVGS